MVRRFAGLGRENGHAGASAAGRKVSASPWLATELAGAGAPRRVALRATMLGLSLLLTLGACGEATPTVPPSAAATTAPTAPPAGSAAVPTASPSAAPSAAASPSATPVAAKTLADLTADPLPTVGAADLAGLEPDVWKLARTLKTWRWSDAHQAPDGADAFFNRPEALSLWACATEAPGETAAQAVTARTIACLSVIAANWADYTQGNQQTALDRARTVYAYAAGQLGTGARRQIDAALALGEQATGPIAHEARELLAAPKTSPSTGDLYAAFREAVLASPESFSGTAFAAFDLTYTKRSGDNPAGMRLDPVLGTCAYFPGAQPRSLPSANFTLVVESLQTQLDACQSLLSAAWRAYKATGSEALYRAAVAAYRYEISRTLSCGGSVCRGEVLDLIKHFIVD